MFHTKNNKNIQYQNNEKMSIRLDLTMMNMMIGVIFKPKSVQITKKSLLNIQKLINMIDETIYDRNEELEARFSFIKKALEAKLDKGFENPDAVLHYCRSVSEDKATTEIIRNLPHICRLSSDEIKYINKAVEDRLQNAYIFKYKDRIYSVLERLDSGDYSSYQDIVSELAPLFTNCMKDIRSAVNIDKSNSFAFNDENVLDLIETVVRRIKDPSRLIKSGIQALNGILAPGFHSKRVYTFFGLPGTFKSGILLSIVYWAKLFNITHKPKKGKIPTILYLTLENDIDETIERLFNMAVIPDDIRDYTPREVAKLFKEKSKLFLRNEEDMNVQIQYFGNREKDTWDVAAMIEDMEDEGKEVVFLVIDYMKRLRPYEKGIDEKQELKNISNELKNLAIEFDIPIVTAQQLNREGQKVIDNAQVNNKEDTTNLLGRGNISTAWEILKLWEDSFNCGEVLRALTTKLS